MSYFENSLFGDQEAEAKRALNRVIYTKTKQWEHENEYRLAIPMMDERDWNLMPFHPEEIVGMYLGAKISEEVERESVKLAKGINPKIGIYRCIVGVNDTISFCLGE